MRWLTAHSTYTSVTANFFNRGPSGPLTGSFGGPLGPFKPLNGGPSAPSQEPLGAQIRGARGPRSTYRPRAQNCKIGACARMWKCGLRSGLCDLQRVAIRLLIWFRTANLQSKSMSIQSSYRIYHIPTCLVREHPGPYGRFSTEVQSTTVAICMPGPTNLLETTCYIDFEWSFYI
jgi:hypothetical protein